MTDNYMSRGACPATAPPKPGPIAALEDCAAQGMNAFDVPGVAAGIVAPDEVLYREPEMRG
jgi:hypothetical protein